MNKDNYYSNNQQNSTNEYRMRDTFPQECGTKSDISVFVVGFAIKSTTWLFQSNIF